MDQKGIAHIFLLLVVLLIIVVAVISFLSYTGIVKNPLQSNKSSSNNKESTVELKTEYKNPFDKNAQYVNPFSEYKNPFNTI